MLISQREYARNKGWSHVYVGKLVKLGKIPATNGKIDPVTADAALAKNIAKDPVKPAKTNGNGHAAPPPDREPTTGVSYLQARTFHETYKAKKEKLEYERMLGQLIEVEEVYRREEIAFGNVASRLRALP